MPDPCITCAAYGDCHGGCRALQELRPDKRDPLRNEPLSDYFPAQEAIELPAFARPQFTGRIRAESFGYALLGPDSVIPLHCDAAELVAACNGRASFTELAEQFGSDGLDLLGEMWERGALKLV